MSSIAKEISAYFSIIEVLVQNILKSPIPPEFSAQLEAMQRTIEAEINTLTIAASNNPNLAAARNTRTARAKINSATQQFRLAWRSSGPSETIEGWEALANRLNYKVSTLRVKFSNGGGKEFNICCANPHTGCDDILYVIKLEPQERREIESAARPAPNPAEPTNRSSSPNKNPTTRE